MPPEEKNQGDGGEQLRAAHTRHDDAHHPLRVLGQQQHQQAQHRAGADKLLGQLHNGGGTDVSRAVKVVFVEVLDAGEEDAGEQQQQAQLGTGIPQQVDRDRVIA